MLLLSKLYLCYQSGTLKSNSFCLLFSFFHYQLLKFFSSANSYLDQQQKFGSQYIFLKEKDALCFFSQKKWVEAIMPFAFQWEPTKFTNSAIWCHRIQPVRISEPRCACDMHYSCKLKMYLLCLLILPLVHVPT